MGSRPHLRRTPRIIGALLSLVVVAACSDAHADDSPPSSASASVADPAAAPTTPTDVSIDPAADLADTGAPGVATSLIDDCVALVQYGAYIGNSLLTEMWNAAGQDVATMRMTCEVTGRSDPGALEGMSAQWADIARYTAAATAPPATAPGDTTVTSTIAPGGSTTTAPATVAVAPPGFECDPNYTGCVPIASDVDCAGQGDGPAFQSEPVGVVARDIYDLDPDGNSVGCG